MTTLLHGIAETTITTGTGMLSLGGAVPGAVSFSARYAVGATVPYLISNGTSKEWGIGTIGAGNTLARTTITGTLVGGVYTPGGTAIPLAGASQVEAVEHEGNDFQTSMAAHVIAASPHGNTYTTPAQAAAAAPVQSVAGKTGAVTLAPADVAGFNAAAAANATTLVTNKAALPATGVSGVLYVALDTGFMWRWNGTTYVGAPFTIDTNGNIIVNVIPRTGLLGNSSTGLLSLAGGAGEIGVATDINALVKFNGVAGQAVAFYRGRDLSGFAVSQSTIVAASGVNTNILINGSSNTVITYNDASVFDPTTGQFVAPANTAAGGFQVNCGLNDASVATSYTATLTLQYYFSSTWFNFLVLASVKTNPSTSNVISGAFPPVVVNKYPFRLILNQNSGVSLTPTTYFSGQYKAA